MSQILAFILASTLAASGPSAAAHHGLDGGPVGGQSNHQSQSAPLDVLGAYRNALSKKDAVAATALFHEASLIVENGKVEGTFAHYLEHHLGPELNAIASFEFFDVQAEADTLSDNIALGRETFSYRIALSDGRVIQRTGAATSVLMRDTDGIWKILRYHSSSRAL